MTENQLGRRFFVLTSLVLFVVGLVGIDRLRLRPDVDFHYEEHGGKVIVTRIEARGSVSSVGIHVGDEIVGLNNRSLSSSAQLEFLVDSNKPGETVGLTIRREGELFRIPVTLSKRYTASFIVLHLIVGLLFWGIGFLVYHCKPEELAARVFAWGTVFISVSLMLNWPGHPYLAKDFGYLLPAIYCLLYPLVPSYILYFCVLYPVPKRVINRFPSLPALLFFPSLVFVVSYEANYIPAIRSLSTALFASYHRAYRLFQGFFILYFLGAIAALIHAYQSAETRTGQKRVQWIFWGISVGGVPFLLLWTVPQLLGFQALIPEEVNYLFMMAVPLSIAFSIVRYHILDIDLVINRSIVYTVVTGLVVGLYLVIVGSIGFLVPAGSLRAGTTLSILATLIAALLFSPIRRRVQRFVDRTFFRVKYKYSKVIRRVSQAFLSAHDKKGLVDDLLSEVNAAIPMTRIAVLSRDEESQHFGVIGSRGMSKEEASSLVVLEHSPLATYSARDALPFVRPGRARLDAARELTEDLMPKNTGILLIIPVVLQDRLIGFLAVGGKRSGARYNEEDLDLLQSVAQECFMTLERLRFQEGMILEQTQRERAEELNKLKSEFVSHVSHELRTPLASLRWSAENLLDGIPEPPSPKVREYLLGIYDSSQRLTKMIENLLDLTRIEAGRIEVNPERLMLRQEAERSITMMQPLAEVKSISIDSAISEELWVHTDRGHLQEITINLLDNAIKYSSEESTVTVAARVVAPRNGEAVRIALSVIDSGPGISNERLSSIFHRFARARDGTEHNEKGLGLGLYIVRQLVELNGGSVAVESTPGKGSTFTVVLPGGDTKAP